MWDEEVTYQGANLARHQEDARRLLERGAAYRCFCTPEQVDTWRRQAEERGEAFKYDRRCDRLAPNEVARRVAAGEPHVVRFRVPEGETSWEDVVHGRITFPNKDIEDFVILRSDATPIYNMAVVSDDIAMRITLVMRGDDHISNTPKQIMLYEALGAALPQFGHLPMIHGLDGKKLSKRHGATAVGDYRHMGILPQAMLNFLALLGWAPGNDIEVMTVPQMVELFSVDGLSKKAAIFDPKKLEWMNGQHLSLLANEALAPLVIEAMVTAGVASRAQLEARPQWLLALIEQLKVRSRTIDDIVRQSVPYFAEHVSYDPDAVAKQWKDRVAASDLLAGAREALASVNTWEPEAMENRLRSLAEQRGLGAGKLFQPLRVALTGLTVSAGIFEVLALLGRERSLARIDDALEYLRS
jgi:glutamyl-tRNA synthetase